MQDAVAEIVTFRLKPGTTPEAFVAMNRAGDAAVRGCDGFLWRQISLGDDGGWTDYVVWRDMDTAKAMLDWFPKQDFAQPLMQAIDPDSLRMRHETVKWEMPPA